MQKEIVTKNKRYIEIILCFVLNKNKNRHFLILFFYVNNEDLLIFYNRNKNVFIYNNQCIMKYETAP